MLGFSSHGGRLLEDEEHPVEEYPGGKDERWSERRERWDFCWRHQGQTGCDILSSSRFQLTTHRV